MDLLQAKASKAATVGGKWIRSDSAAMTKPSESRTTTPKPAVAMSEKVAPSKFTL